MQPDVAGMQVAGNEKRDEKTKMQNAEKMTTNKKNLKPWLTQTK